jgi:hypothetical protein
MNSMTFRNCKRKMPGRPNARAKRTRGIAQCDCKNRRVQRFLRRTKEKNNEGDKEETQEKKPPKPDCELNPDRFATMIVDRERIKCRLREGEDLGEIRTDEQGNILDFAIVFEGKPIIASVMEHMIELVSKAKNISHFAKMALIASIALEKKGDSSYLNNLCEESERIGIRKIFISALAGAIRDRDLRRFEMAFEIKE